MCNFGWKGLLTGGMQCRWLKKEEYGKVPRYLQNIKVGLAKQHAEQQAAKEAAMVPPGRPHSPDSTASMTHMIAAGLCSTSGRCT